MAANDKNSYSPQKLNRFTFTVVCVVLVVVLCIGSALAVNVGNMSVSAPDPYGAVTLSLNDATTARTLFNSDTITYGSGNTSNPYRYEYASQTAQITPGLSLLTDSIERSNVYGYLKVPAGTYLDYICVVNYPASEWSSLIINGGGTASVQNVTEAYTPTAYPDTVQLLVNGQPVGDPVVYDNGFTFPTITVQVTSDVYNIGYRFTYTDEFVDVASNGSNIKVVQLGFEIADNAIVTAIENDETDPYIPLLMANNSWLQSIFGNTNISNSLLEKIASSLSNMSGTNGIQAIVQALSPEVENSQGWYTKEIADAFDTETEGTVGNTIADIGSVYASEEDIVLKENTSGLQSAVIENFFPGDTDSSGSGSNGSLSVNKDTISEVKDVTDQVGSMLDTGYSVGDMFEAMQDDSITNWFSSEVASDLDTTGYVSPVDDDDPFNMWVYFKQFDILGALRGGNNG